MFEWSKLSAAQWLDAWEERLHGIPNTVIDILKGGKTVRVRVFAETAEPLSDIANRFGGTVREIKTRDWVAESTQAAPPRKIRDALLLTGETAPAALAALAAAHPKRHLLSIPAEMAFGTGDHATTATCLRLLVDVARGRQAGWSVADLGCGTGVLAMAARQLGAGETYACDFDAFAVASTESNLARNGITGVVVEERDVLHWQPTQRYDVVVANLFSTVLIEAFPVIAQLLRPQGELIISGILADQAWGVFTAAAEYGLGFPTVVRKGKWVTARGAWMDDLCQSGALGAG